ncbi:MAG: hypothetical protein U0X40_06035 [Ferruginibacter sp.]
MPDELNNILSNDGKEIGPDKLLGYLNNELSAGDAHEVEKHMADDPFVNDAVEGLEAFGNKNELQTYVQQLNRDLQQQLDKKKKRREKRRLKEQPWIYFAIILVLLLIIIAYLVIKKTRG